MTVHHWAKGWLLLAKPSLASRDGVREVGWPNIGCGMKSLIVEQVDMNVGPSNHYIPCPAKKKI